MQLACTSASQESFIGSRTGIVFDGTLGTKRLLLLLSNSIENSSSSGMQMAILVSLRTAAAALVVVMLKHSAFCTFWLRSLFGNALGYCCIAPRPAAGGGRNDAQTIGSFGPANKS
ncbi:unnamed protein product [Fraxinus pennsylvanica]|uniref:Uncharacterized protein n=1 Tax=Fraxinus pennsylvanica TaxID=56036 RepID=A0AAD1Z1N9_9LAMI|nr:unnamed protein product [Fraxinus pennsylvanica]